MKVWIVTFESFEDHDVEGVYVSEAAALSAHPAPKACSWEPLDDQSRYLKGLPYGTDWFLTAHEVQDVVHLRTPVSVLHTE